MKEESRFGVRKYSFSQRTIKVWNTLSADCMLVVLVVFICSRTEQTYGVGRVTVRMRYLASLSVANEIVPWMAILLNGVNKLGCRNMKQTKGSGVVSKNKIKDEKIIFRIIFYNHIFVNINSILFIFKSYSIIFTIPVMDYLFIILYMWTLNKSMVQDRHTDRPKCITLALVSTSEGNYCIVLLLLLTCSLTSSTTSLRVLRRVG